MYSEEDSNNLTKVQKKYTLNAYKLKTILYLWNIKYFFNSQMKILSFNMASETNTVLHNQTD